MNKVIVITGSTRGIGLGLARAFLLADRVETVTPWLADRVLANDRTGVRIKWLTAWRLIRRVLTAPFRRRDLFED